MNDRLYHLKNARLNIISLDDTTLYKRIVTQAALGNIALHVDSSLINTLYKLDDPAILGNLREDGGAEFTESSKKHDKNFQLYLNVSCTVLPPSNYPVAQNLYSYLGDIFIGFDITKGIIRNFSSGDGQSTYELQNKHKRPSYKMLFFDEHLPSQSPQSRYDYVKKRNEDSAIASSTKGKGTFSRREPSFKRGVNELLLKINLASMAFIGATAAEVLQHPEILLKLILMQQTLKLTLNITYPILIYNNANVNNTIDFLDSNEITLLPNQLTLVDSRNALAAMSKKFTDDVVLNFNKNTYSINDITHRCNEIDNDKNKSLLSDELSMQVQNGLHLLAEKLRSYSDEDNIITIHKEKKNDAVESEKYLEINQENLKKFITESILNNNYLSQNEEMPAILAKAYNLQFRLFMYSKLLAHKSIVNYENIQQDLKWLAIVMNKLSDVKLDSQNNFEKGTNPKM